MIAALYSSPWMVAWASGMATGLGLFAAVGAQSAFILRQALSRMHILSVLAVCALADAVFIFASAAGVHVLTARLPALAPVVQWGGVAFLAWYGTRSARRALRGGAGMQAADGVMRSRRAAVLAALGFTLLNPHFWLDLVVVGSLAHGFEHTRMAFAAGAVSASVLWLAVLGWGARLLAPLFRSARAWRVLDAMIALAMYAVALRLAWMAGGAWA
jgi:Lysine efflux permease